MKGIDDIRVKEGCCLRLKRFFFVKLKDKNFLKGISSVIGACLLNFIAGGIFAVCQLFVYEISYIKAKNNNNITNDDEIFYYPIIKFLQHVFTILSGILYKKIGLHFTNLIGFITLFIGYLILYLSSSLTADIFSVIFAGIGTGIIYYPSTANACEWYVNHNGIIIGIIETMISLGSFSFNLLGEKIAEAKKHEYKSENEYKIIYDDNPSEIYYRLEVAEKFKEFMIYLLIFVVVFYLLSFALIFRKKEEEFKDAKNIQVGLLQLENNENYDENEKEYEEKPLEISDHNIEPEKKPRDFKKIFIGALKSKIFIMFAIVAVLEAPLSSMIFSLYRTIGLKKKINEMFLSTIGPINFVFECIGGFVFGLFCDYIPKKVLLLFIMGSDVIIGYFYCLTFNSSVLFFIFTNFCSFISGGFYSVKDFFLIKIFGVYIYVELIGFINLLSSIIVIAVLTPLSYHLNKTFSSESSPWIMFIIFGTCDLVGFIISLFIKDENFDYDKAMEDDKEKEENNRALNGQM